MVGKKEERDPIGLEDIAEVWGNTLGVSRSSIKPEHSFFDLGGHSLTLADLATRLSRNFGIKVPVSCLAAPPILTGYLDIVRAVRDS